MKGAQQATDKGLEAHYKVRVVLPGAILHLASRTEPRIVDGHYDTDVARVDADWIADPAYGDTIGYMDWGKVVAVTWRYAT